MWEPDIKYGYIVGERKFFSVQAMLDVADRMVVDDHIGLICTGDQAAPTLRGALGRRERELSGSRPAICTFNGPQFTSAAWKSKLSNSG